MDNNSNIFTEIANIKAQIDHHEKEAQKYRDMLKQIIEAASGNVSKGVPAAKAGAGATFEDTVSDMLKDLVPRSTGEIKAMYENLTGKKFDTSNFSARLIGIRNKENPKVHSFKIEGIADNYWLPIDCFNKNKTVKPEYRDKVKKP